MKRFLPLFVLVLLLGVWQFRAGTPDRSPLWPPPPSEIFDTLVEKRAAILHNAAVTCKEAVGGFLLGCTSAVALAALGSFYPVVRGVSFPYAVAIKATPIIVLAPLIVLRLGDGYWSKIVMAAVVCFFPVLVNTTIGLQSVEKDWVDLLRLHRASRWEIFWLLRLPNALPEIFAGLRTAISLAMVGAVVAEFTGAQEGLGNAISVFSYDRDIRQVYAYVVTTSVLGLALYYAVVWLHRRVVFWRPEN